MRPRRSNIHVCRLGICNHYTELFTDTGALTFANPVPQYVGHHSSYHLIIIALAHSAWVKSATQRWNKMAQPFLQTSQVLLVSAAKAHFMHYVLLTTVWIPLCFYYDEVIWYSLALTVFFYNNLWMSTFSSKKWLMSSCFF